MNDGGNKGEAMRSDIVIIGDTENHPLFREHPLLPNTHSEMAVPMIVADQLVGIFDVKADILNRFTEDDKRTYSTLASQTAVALQNAQLYEEQIKTVENGRELLDVAEKFRPDVIVADISMPLLTNSSVLPSGLLTLTLAIWVRLASAARYLTSTSLETCQ